MKIAVIGSGIAGLAAARALSARWSVELFEAAPEPGGHVHTVPVTTGGGPPLAIDTGFIIYNERTYPRLTRLFAELGVATRRADMSFSASCAACGIAWGSGGLGALLAGGGWRQPGRWRLLAAIVRLFGKCRRDLEQGDAGALDRITLGDYLADRDPAGEATRHFLVPMAAAIWSTAPRELMTFPAGTQLRFMARHGMLGVTGAPEWRTVVGGSRVYVDRLLGELRAGAGGRAPGRVHLATPIVRVRRNGGITLELGDGEPRRFDRVVIATHADSALALLADPSPDERRLLGQLRYTRTESWLHTDTGRLPRARAAWSAWNHAVADCRSPGSAVEATYWMNRLQGLPGTTQYCVTLNPARPIDPAHVLRRIAVAHPLLDHAALAAQRELPRLQGVRGTYFCGAYHGNGFHEDGLRAGQEAAARLLGERPARGELSA